MGLDAFAKLAIIVTFCLIMLMVFGTLLFGLFHDKVDNGEIFKVLGHDFDLILVALTGYMGGRASTKTS